MKYKIFSILYILILSQDIEYIKYTFDEVVNKINDVPYNTTDYDNIILNILEALENHYVFFDIAKVPPIDIEPVDLVSKFKSINTQNITFYEFYQQVSKIIISLKDIHTKVYFFKFENFTFNGPLDYKIRTKNNTNKLYAEPLEMSKKFFPQELIDQINEFKNYSIIKINGKEPFDYIQNFGMQILKDKHAQFTYNFKIFNANKFDIYPFSKEDLENITITYENGRTLSFDYIILEKKQLSKEFSKYYLKEKEKYFIVEPNIFQIEYEFSKRKNIEYRNLQTNYWDYDFGILKLKIENEKKVNVIIQTSFQFDYNNGIEQFKKIMEAINSNNYPIIIVEIFNGGGITPFPEIFQKIINFDINNIKYKFSNRITDLNKEALSNNNVVSLNCETKKLKDYFSKEKIDKYSNEVNHKRTEEFIYKETEFYYSYYGSIKRQKRKPTEIIIFTDGFSYSCTSTFIKYLQNYGSAIIVGYLGNPSNETKNEKFDSSQSPSSVNQLNQFNSKYYSNLLKYNITMSITFQESFSDNYQDNNSIIYPLEYMKFPIDERVNIYNLYVSDFINEGLNIIEKYKKECNSDNKKLLLLNDSCKFENDSHAHGGFQCGNDGKWSNVCVPSYCDEGYIFDTFYRKCIKDECLNFIWKQKLYFWIIFIVVFLVVVFIGFFIFRKVKKRNKNQEIEKMDSIEGMI